MEQDLFGWLNSQRNFQGTGLLVAPMSPEPTADDSGTPENELLLQESHEEITIYPPESETVETESALPELHQEITTSPHESGTTEAESAPQESQEEIPTYIQESATTENESASEFQTPDNVPALPESHEKIPTYTPESDEPVPEAETPENEPAPAEAPDETPDYNNHEWQERATGFTLSLDEPPPELWTNINNDDDDSDYEPTDSLQGAAYVQIHGRNFTERLHHTLKHRKERAEERALLEPEPDPINPLKQMTVILCGTLIMALGFAVMALWFVGRETPKGMKSRAEALVEAGQYDEAAEIYRKAHRRYPNDTEILAGLAQSSQKVGHVQTAKTARDEYIRLTSPDIPTKKPEAPKPEPQIPPAPAHVSIPITEKPLTFDECMSEANHAYNIGMYTRALRYFADAMKINPRDFRPYIGLSASYRMKGWYVDSMHILEEARRKFGRSPALDMELYFLQEAK